MAKYIEKDAFLRQYGPCNPEVFEKPEHANGWNALLSAVETFSPADVEPVRHGRWYAMRYVSGVLEGTKNDKCSVCGYERVYEDETYKTRYFFCPRCGSKMDLEEPE